ncbi:MAG TPA: Hsp20/alpha crystallin family protein [Dehalococcoidia bacterium]|nr:Hsp20/alpha crystallin family protein [Dehalococcoidia bacterium]
MVKQQRSMSEFERFHHQMERMWSQLVGDMVVPPSYCTNVFDPPVDVYEENGRVVVVMEIAGIRGQEIGIEVDEQRLTVRGVRPGDAQGAKRSYSQLEICRGEFRRNITLPVPVDVGSIEVAYEDGFLRLSLAKASVPGKILVRRRTTS